MFGMDKLSPNRVASRFGVTRRRTKVRREAKFVHSKNAFIKRKRAKFCAFSSFCVFLVRLHKLCSPLYSRFCDPDFFYIPFFVDFFIRNVYNENNNPKKGREKYMKKHFTLLLAMLMLFSLLQVPCTALSE